MSAYVLVAVWLLGNIACIYLIKKRDVKPVKSKQNTHL